MRKRYWLLIIFVLFILGNATTISEAQTERKQFIEQGAHATLENFVKSDSFKRFKIRHYESANGILDLELVLKGRKVETVFIDNSTVSPPEFVNDFATFMKGMNFDFKLPKGERLKIKHQFIIQ